MVEENFESIVGENLQGFSNLTRSNQLKVCGSVLGYVFNHISSSEMTKRIRLIEPELKIKPMRLAVMNSGYLMRNAKLFTYAKAAQTGNIRANDYDLNPEDAKLVKYLLGTSPDLSRMLSGLYARGKGYKPATIGQMVNLVGYVNKEVEDFTSKFVYRKLRFIAESNGSEEKDLRNTLLYKATYAIYRQYPRFKSRLHAVNIAKQTIHNTGINMILEATSESRSRLVASKDGTFSSTVLSLDSIGTGHFLDHSTYLNQCNYLVTSINGGCAQGDTLTSMHDRFELKQSVSALYKDIGNPVLRNLMKLWSGEWDEGFSNHLGRPNDEWFDTAETTEYLVACAKYLKVPGSVAKAFLAKLRSDLKDYE